VHREVRSTSWCIIKGKKDSRRGSSRSGPEDALFGERVVCDYCGFRGAFPAQCHLRHAILEFARLSIRFAAS
jgi:hypothetical protein